MSFFLSSVSARLVWKRFFGLTSTSMDNFFFMSALLAFYCTSGVGFGGICTAILGGAIFLGDYSLSSFDGFLGGMRKDPIELSFDLKGSADGSGVV